MRKLYSILPLIIVTFYASIMLFFSPDIHSKGTISMTISDAMYPTNPLIIALKLIYFSPFLIVIGLCFLMTYAFLAIRHRSKHVAETCLGAGVTATIFYSVVTFTTYINNIDFGIRPGSGIFGYGKPETMSATIFG